MAHTHLCFIHSMNKPVRHTFLCWPCEVLDVVLEASPHMLLLPMPIWHQGCLYSWWLHGRSGLWVWEGEVLSRICRLRNYCVVVPWRALKRWSNVLNLSPLPGLPGFPGLPGLQAPSFSTGCVCALQQEGLHQVLPAVTGPCWTRSDHKPPAMASGPPLPGRMIPAWEPPARSWCCVFSLQALVRKKFIGEPVKWAMSLFSFA